MSNAAAATKLGGLFPWPCHSVWNVFHGVAPIVVERRLCSFCRPAGKGKALVQRIPGADFRRLLACLRKAAAQDLIASCIASTKSILLLVKMKEKKLLKMQSLPKVLRSQATRRVCGANFLRILQNLCKTPFLNCFFG